MMPNEDKQKPARGPVYLTRSQFRAKFEKYLDSLTPAQCEEHANELLGWAANIEQKYGGAEVVAAIAEGRASAYPRPKF
jgi:hypothetical protein